MALDLHIHSTYSDGTLTPEAIVRLAARKGLKGISITDHDTAEGVEEAVAAGKRCSIEVIPGIELSVVHEGQHMHLLGYGINPKEAGLAEALRKIQHDRIDRNERIITKLQNLGIDISMTEVERKSPEGQTGRPHIAQVMLEKRVIRSIDDGFARFLKKGAVAYVERAVLSAVGAIRLLKDAGGIAVLAHPVTIDITLKKIPQLLEQLKKAGLDGVETYYPIHSSRHQKSLCELARRYNLVVTGGSDYHGDIRPGTTLAGGKNVYVPIEVLQQLKDRINR